MWLAAAVLDYAWQRRTNIESTAGLSESLMRSLTMSEGTPVIFGAGVIFTSPRPRIQPAEQHTRGFLEMAPFRVASVAVYLHWDQFLALPGQGTQKADFRLRPRRPLLPRRRL